MRSVVAVLVIGLIACGDSDSESDFPPDTARSGSRLKLAWWELADGFRTWVSSTDLFDAELEVACTPMRWDDGITRCAPELGRLAYLDAACTQPVMLDSSKTFAADQIVVCDELLVSGDVFMQTTQQTERTMTLWSKGTSGECAQLSLPQPITVGVPDTTLAPADLVEILLGYQGTGDAAVATFYSDDGLIVPARLEDARHRMTCDLGPLARADRGTCITEVPIASAFADDTCRDPRVPVPTGCEPPEVARLQTLGCSRYFEVSDTAESSALYQSSFGCIDAPMEGDAYALESEIDVLRIDRAPAPSATRMQSIYASSGTVRFRDRPLYDSELDSECTLLPVADGQTSTCEPPLVQVHFDAYSDADCTQPLPPLVRDNSVSDGCTISKRPRYARGPQNELFRIGQRHAGTVYTQFAASCDFMFDPMFELAELSTVSPATAVKRRDP